MSIETTFPDVDPEILERFLKLLVDRFPKADMANNYLEHKHPFYGEGEGPYSGLSITVANQRDAVSHLVTLLSNPGRPEHQAAQLAAAEEHLRRAIMEPYQIAVSLKRGAVADKYREYEHEVVSRRELPETRDAPSLDSIRSAISEVEELRSKARMTKTLNSWNDEWEEGIRHFLKAHEILDEQLAIMSKYIARARRAASRRKQLSLNVASLVIGVLGFLVGLFSLL